MSDTNSESNPASGMHDFLDEKAITTKLATKALDRLLSFGEKVVKERWARHKNSTFESFANYLYEKSIRCRQMRSLLDDSTVYTLRDLYVPARLRNGPSMFSESNFLKLFVQGNLSNQFRRTHAAIVQGPAGSGKSVLFKSAFLRLQSLSNERIPILFELRALNSRKLHNPNSPSVDEWSYILHDEITSHGKNVSVEQVQDGLKFGLFTLLLDGVDEIKPTLQPLYERLIVDLTKKYPECPLLVSGRPMARLAGWQDFSLYEVESLNLNEAVELVKKSPADSNLKSDFIAEVTVLDKTDFKEFIGNPLLLQIMMITFSDIRRISRLKHEFYEDAFQALWVKHDLRKQGFERRKYSGLDRREFLELTGGFAFSSYLLNDVAMRAQKFSEHFLRALKLSKLVAKEEEYKQDLLVSTSLFVEDGLMLKFSHRSFQEYFASCFISKLLGRDFEVAIDAIADRYETDQVLPFLLSHSPDIIEQYWILPQTAKALNILGVKSNSSVQTYAKKVLGRANTAESESAQKTIAIVRHLYQFRRNKRDLDAAFDAWVEIQRTKTDSLLTEDFETIFANDRDAVVGLINELRRKYSRSREALDSLLH